MSARLRLLERWMPRWLRRRMFRSIVQLTAESFAADVPPLTGLSEAQAIRAFATFTRGQVERALARGDTEAQTTRARLREGAREMGERVRRQLGIRTRAEAFRALRLLYRGIGIAMDTDSETGDLVVWRCAFSGVYTPAVCAFVSALDDGFACGLTRGSRLAFSGRITEGSTCCRARVAGAAS